MRIVCGDISGIGEMLERHNCEFGVQIRNRHPGVWRGPMSVEVQTGRSNQLNWGVVAVLCLAVFPSGCSDGDSDPLSPGPCTAIYVAGVLVEVSDSETGFPAACGATLIVTEGSYQEENAGICLSGRPDEEQYQWLTGAYERPGVYTLRIEKHGYVPWEQAAVVVEAGGCHVQTVDLVVALEPTN